MDGRWIWLEIGIAAWILLGLLVRKYVDFSKYEEDGWDEEDLTADVPLTEALAPAMSAGSAESAGRPDNDAAMALTEWELHRHRLVEEAETEGRDWDEREEFRRYSVERLRLLSLLEKSNRMLEEEGRLGRRLTDKEASELLIEH